MSELNQSARVWRIHEIQKDKDCANSGFVLLEDYILLRNQAVSQLKRKHAKWRIVEQCPGGYVIQRKEWFFFWTAGSMFYDSFEDAKSALNRLKKLEEHKVKVVYYD